MILMRKPVIKIHISLILILLISCFIGQIKNALLMLLILLIHELGHLFFCILFRCKVKSITISMIGGVMDIDFSKANPLKKILIFCGWPA